MRALALSVLSLACLTTAAADEVRLKNGDTVKGDVVSLDAATLVLKSESFGELTIKRDQIALIGLGPAGIPAPPEAAPAQGNAAAGNLPVVPLGGGGFGNLNDLQQMLGEPQVQQEFGGLLQEALGGRSVLDVQRDLQRSRQGLQELSEDLGGLEGEAIGNYAEMLNVLGNLGQLGGQVAPQPRPGQMPNIAPNNPGAAPNVVPGGVMPPPGQPGADQPQAPLDELRPDPNLESPLNTPDGDLE